MLLDRRTRTRRITWHSVYRHHNLYRTHTIIPVKTKSTTSSRHTHTTQKNAHATRQENENPTNNIACRHHNLYTVITICIEHIRLFSELLLSSRTHIFASKASSHRDLLTKYLFDQIYFSRRPLCLKQIKHFPEKIPRTDIKHFLDISLIYLGGCFRSIQEI